MTNYQNLMDPQVQSCPYSLYKRLRSKDPIYKMPETGFYLITSFELCNEVMRQPDLFLSGVSPMALQPEGVPKEVIEVYEKNGWLPKASCSTSDPPRHTWVRKLLTELFTVSRVKEMTPFIEQTATNLIDDFSRNGMCEFVKEFAHPLPMLVIANQIGVKSQDIHKFKEWSDAIVEPFSMMITHEREVECANLVVEMQRYFSALIYQRKANPINDLLSIIANAKDDKNEDLKMDEMLSIVTIDLLASGNETTTAAISSGLLMLIDSPETFYILKSNPQLIPNFVEEILRLESPAQGMFREVRKNTCLGGVDLKAGDILSLRFGSANRDEKKFSHPKDIILDRKPAGGHLAFGVGRHHCIGAPLARQELISSFNVLIKKFSDFELIEIDKPIKYTPSFFGRNPEKINIKFNLSD
jgi:cytochrome P450